MIYPLGKDLQPWVDFLSLPINDNDILIIVRNSDLSKPLAVRWRDLKTALVVTGAISVSDEGTVVVNQAANINFTGAGVTVTANGGSATVNIPGGGGGTPILLQTNNVTNPVQTILNLVEGTNMTITDDGSGNITFDASGGGGGVQSVTGVNVDNTDPLNPVVDTFSSIETHLTQGATSTITLSSDATPNHGVYVDFTVDPYTSLTINSYPSPKDGALLIVRINKPGGQLNILNAYIAANATRTRTYILKYDASASSWVGFADTPHTVVSSIAAIAPITVSGTSTSTISTSVAQNKLIGRGSSSGTGVMEEITIGSGLTLTGTTLAASGGGGTVTSVNAGVNISVTGTATDPIVNSLSDRYKTTSVTSNSISNGSKTFTIDANLSYIPLQEILVVHNPSNHMHGEVTSYNSTTGVLVVDIKNHTGSGTYTSWDINLDGTPVDALSGAGTANEIAYFTGAQTLGSLAVATYPSLTELSYVKGVTSGIQGQINPLKTSSIVTILDGQGGVVQIGRGNNFLSIPFAGTITGWTILSSVSGSIEVAFWRTTYSLFDPPTVPTSASSIFSPNPTLSTSKKNTATGLSIAVTAGDIIIPNVVSVTTCTNVTISIQITRS